MNDPAATYRFGKFVLETRDRRLSSDGHEIYLRPKTYETLLYLLERHGHLVTKDELLGAVWADVEVTENALTRCTKETRAALGDEVQEPSFVRTIPRLGYEFIANVQMAEAQEEAEVFEEEFRALRVVITEDDTGSGSSETVPAQRDTAVASRQDLLVQLKDASKRKLLVGLGLLLTLAALLGLALGIWLHTHGTQVLSEHDTLILGDFDNTTGEPVFDGALKQGLAVQLEQSPFLNIVSATPSETDPGDDGPFRSRAA